MTQFGIVADIHANVEALEAVLCAFDRLRIRDVFCLGDLVGYCAEPNACVVHARERAFRAIKGNHELIALGELGFERCGLAPAQALRRTRETLDDASRRFLTALPPSLVHEREVVLIHGSVEDVCEYMSNEDRVRRNHLALSKRYPGANVCLFGHTHVPKAYELRNGRVIERRADGVLPLTKEATWFINPGSVDGSRAPQREARFAVFDDGPRTVTFHRAPYDHRKVERRARRAGYRLPRSTLAWHASIDLAREAVARLTGDD